MTFLTYISIRAIFILVLFMFWHCLRLSFGIILFVFIMFFKKKNKVHPHKFSNNYFSKKAMKAREKRDARNVNIGLVCAIVFIGLLV
tara:strand:- start:308 stop:568 length:261 start_codon:yes stop_codon:yes gene_type:complete